MADIYLGEIESAINPLPPLRWAGGGSPSFPHSYSKQIEQAVMADGSTRFDIKSKHPRSWRLKWSMLTAAELQRFIALNEINDALYFQNNWEDATWRRVVIERFDYEPAVNIGPVGCRFSVDLALSEVV